MDFDTEKVRCPKCNGVLTGKDFVGAKYDDGLVRWTRHWNRKTEKWECTHYTKSNMLFLRCACGANVRVKMHMRVEQNKQGEFDE